MKKIRIILAAVAALLMVGLMTQPASAATASATEWTLVGNASLGADVVAGTGQVVRLPAQGPVGSPIYDYAYTTVFQSVLNAKPGQTIQVCAKGYAATAGLLSQVTVSNGVWSVTFGPYSSTARYDNYCANVTNSTTQPFGAVSVVTDGTYNNMRLKSVTIN